MDNVEAPRWKPHRLDYKTAYLKAVNQVQQCQGRPEGRRRLTHYQVHPAVVPPHYSAAPCQTTTTALKWDPEVSRHGINSAVLCTTRSRHVIFTALKWSHALKGTALTRDRYRSYLRIGLAAQSRWGLLPGLTLLYKRSVSPPVHLLISALPPPLCKRFASSPVHVIVHNRWRYDIAVTPSADHVGGSLYEGLYEVCTVGTNGWAYGCPSESLVLCFGAETPEHLPGQVHVGWGQQPGARGGVSKRWRTRSQPGASYQC